MHRTAYSNVNILLNTTELCKVSDSCLTEVVFNKIARFRKTTFNGLFKGRQILQQ